MAAKKYQTLIEDMWIHLSMPLLKNTFNLDFLKKEPCSSYIALKKKKKVARTVRPKIQPYNNSLIRLQEVHVRGNKQKSSFKLETQI